ncbi:MAG: ribosomal protein S12 methylthiotransferase [Candidatus Magnetoglobus multicellularis str. Araruama]|uniref:Ribosomal protein S12 methylthiotransferase n=1 Tax=Candidatus Magnetoglobus multicellularis str. Araruama TaxID=890399 RepID=A0A1V1P183_9BACT|nr:MAG: ribosomal protein S12 methylthiotransferase [Candidatus Magnetoglobus multicellularis str. Araruama]
MPPEETIRLAKRQLEKIDLDILQETRRIDNNRLGIPVYFSICGEDAQKRTGKRKQMGKGADPAQAEASAIMELIERFSLYDFISTPHNFHVDTFQNIQSKGIDFESIARSVHDTVDRQSPEYPFFAELPLQWTKAFDIQNNTWVEIPFDWFFQINAYNGSSAGNCLEESIIQGMSEVVERHACHMILKNKMSTPQIDLDTVTDPTARELIHRYHQAGIELAVYNYSMDTGIPVLGGVAWDPSTFPKSSEIVWTAGAMPDPGKALCRVLTEIAQLGGDFNTHSNYEPSGLPKLTQVDDIHIMHPDSLVIPFSDLPDLSHDNIKIEIFHYQKALRSLFPNIFIVDLTHPVIQLPACYVMMPGACFRERAIHASVGLFTAKLISTVYPPDIAITKLDAMDRAMSPQYYIPFYKGTVLMNQSEHEKALESFYIALDRGPLGEDRCGIYLYMGMCEKNAQRYTHAISALKNADAIDDCRTDVLNLLGVCYYKTNQFHKAVESFERLIAIDPGSALDHANLGVNYKALGEKQKARLCFEKALSLDAGIDFAWEHLLQL